MDAKTYMQLALRTASEENKMIHACFGIGGESGEILDIVKKSVFYGKELNREHLVEEIGDALWYFNLLIHALDSSWGEVFEANIRKLEARYPNLRFEADKAVNRDKGAEKAAMSL